MASFGGSEANQFAWGTVNSDRGINYQQFPVLEKANIYQRTQICSNFGISCPIILGKWKSMDIDADRPCASSFRLLMSLVLFSLALLMPLDF